MIGALDPGIDGCGVSVSKATEIQAAAYIKNPLGKNYDKMMRVLQMAEHCAQWFGQYQIQILIVEWPQIYHNAQQPFKDPKHLLELAGIVSAVGAILVVPTRRYLPREWKGSISGDAHTVRVRDRLSDQEFARVELPGNSCTDCSAKAGGLCSKTTCLAHNVWDGVGLNLKYLGRLERQRVIAR